jgi:hypothetical protein
VEFAITVLPCFISVIFVEFAITLLPYFISVIFVEIANFAAIFYFSDL